MPPSTTPDVSLSEILDRLDDRSAPDCESRFLNHGDDILDVMIGLQQMIRNKRLFGCPPLPVGAWNGDAIAVGSGPSLMDHMDDLRRAQDKMLIVAAHSAVPKLLQHGVIPHMITPKERDPDIGIIPNKLPEKVVYAGLPCVPVAPDRCHTAYLVGCSDPILRWLGFARDDIGTPQNSGTLAAYVASVVSTGALYLVGYDMTIGHYDGFKFPEETTDGDIECADGVRRPSCRIYRVAQAELNAIADRKRVVQMNPKGGLVRGAKSQEPLLNIQPRNVWDAPAGIMSYVQSPVQYGQFESQVRKLPNLFRTAEYRLSRAHGSAAMTTKALFGDDHLLGTALFQSVYVGTSILKRTMNLSDDETAETLRVALGNPIKALGPISERMLSGLH